MNRRGFSLALAFPCLLAFMPIAGKAQFVYAVNSGTSCEDGGTKAARLARPQVVCVETGNSISGWVMDPTTGNLSPLAGSPFPAGADANSVTVDVLGQFLYVTNENDGNIGVYTIDPLNGGLTPTFFSPFAAGTEPNSVRVHPSAHFVYAANEGDSTISGYSIDPGPGTLIPLAGSPFSTPGFFPDSIAFDPSGRFLYASSGDIASPTGAVLAYTVDAATGALTPIPGSPFPAGTDIDTVIVDPKGRFVYAGDFAGQQVFGFTIDPGTGALTAILGSPFPVGGAPDEITVDPSGRFLYTANDGNIGPAGVGAFTIDQVTGALTAVTGSPFTAGTEPSGVTVDLSGRYLFVANENSNNVSVFFINSGTGALTEVVGSPFAAGPEPVKIAVAPQNLFFLYPWY